MLKPQPDAPDFEASIASPISPPSASAVPENCVTARPLTDARNRREEAKKLIDAGTDPSVKKKLDKIAAETAARNTFGLIAKDFLSNLTANNLAERTIAKNAWLLRELAAPLADRPIADITRPKLLISSSARLSFDRERHPP